MPRVYYALLLSLFIAAPMTPLAAAPPPGAAAFNVPLRDGAGKSTPPTAGRKVTTGNCSPAATTMTVVLDAGHGGKDPGGMGKNSHEKAIALQIARLLAIGIRTNFPTVEVIMTRSDDTFIPLYERAAIANRAGADLFISIHANIMPGSSATYGTETFVMGQHVAKHNLAVAKRENASILLEDQGKVRENYGYDPNSDEGHILMSTFQHSFLERSIQFADLVEREFAAAGRKSRGVKQAGFVVLKETTMPAVLVETGFMSNPEEEAYLLSGVGQQKLANALLKAFRTYLISVSDAGPALTVTASPSPEFRRRSPSAAYPPAPRPSARTVNVHDREVAPPPATAPTPQRRRQWTARSVSDQPLTYTPSAPTGTPLAGPTTPRPVSASAASANAAVLRREVTAGLRATRPSVYQQAAVQAAAVSTDTIPGGYRFKNASRRQAPPAPPRGPLLRDIPDSQLTYAVQLIATERTLDLTEPRWTAIPYPISRVPEGKYNKYQIRGLKTAAEAAVARDRAQAAGIFDAMVVAYYQGRRLTRQQVQVLLAR